mmetsp:Transcript_14150/g.17878  ORF Transcript_14150/g.17878 Transcript_14150/m.17878 type:complete len:147 (+) Transcript_14150:275-715(+)|eukprot:CAMPEP_0203636110 /NCGR_PEP_ID=MMETSP0088-20131115/2734_1 /ASSEMBLY_ACC=CAM_ASM_001087 /TAXON_ID=426623 /ORGANISM="Chaetoceros affinis, Strain CCMP159" /LENGTH=146 /DNA_ID=CAMNT_0050490161 /DNA_START=176 /DNA_END=616 /DNA_ORIENTATION=-
MDDIPNIPTYDDEYQSELMNFLSQSSEMRNTAKGALKQSLFSAGGAFAGAFIAGPVGGLVGGVVGSVTGFMNSSDYDGAIVAITNLEPERRNRLVGEIFTVLKGAGATVQSLGTAQAFGSALHHYAANESVRNGIWNACLHATSPS